MAEEETELQVQEPKVPEEAISSPVISETVEPTEDVKSEVDERLTEEGKEETNVEPALPQQDDSQIVQGNTSNNEGEIKGNTNDGKESDVVEENANTKKYIEEVEGNTNNNKDNQNPGDENEQSLALEPSTQSETSNGQTGNLEESSPAEPSMTNGSAKGSSDKLDAFEGSPESVRDVAEDRSKEKNEERTLDVLVETKDQEAADGNTAPELGGKDGEENSDSQPTLASPHPEDREVLVSSSLKETTEIGQGEETAQETTPNDDDDGKEKKNGEITLAVTTDVVSEDMEGSRKGRESSVGSQGRTAKTPESITASVDLPIGSQLVNQSRTSNRPVTADSEYVYNEHDFATPDYEMYGPTPTTTDSEKSRRLLSPNKRDRQLASRGESIKSVTFADDVSKGSEKGEEEEEEEQRVEGEKEESQKEGFQQGEDKGEKGSEEEEKNEDQEKKETAGEEESGDIFPTAVSEEKIEEAKKKQKEQQDGFTRKESLAIELFGASKFEPESMEDVVSKRAYQHFERGCNLGERGDFAAAVLCFDKALNLLPREVKFYLMRGEAYLQLCDFQSAILNLKKACVLQPTNEQYYSRLAFVYYFQGQSLFDQCLFPEALESFSRAAEMRPEIVAYHTRSIACLAALQRHGECLALVNRRLETERSNPDLFIMRARLHQLFRNMTLCYYDLKDALALDPNQAEAQALMSQLEEKAEENRGHATRLQLLGKLKDGLTKITIAIEMNPSVAEYHLQRGALQRRLHDYNAAIDDFLLAMDKTEHNEHNSVYTDAQRQLLLTYNDFAVECFLGGHYEEAILLLNKALKGEKREKGLYINRGDCFFRLQELHFALADYHQASELDGADPGIRSRVAAIHGQFGLQDYEEHIYQDADARFTLALQHNPRHGPYYIARCKVRLMMENPVGARQDFLMGLHLDSSNTDILTLMPRIYPGKSVGDVMRTKQAKDAKVAADNAVMTASPIRLPGIDSGGAGGQQGAVGGKDDAKHVSFASVLLEGQDAVVPTLKYCMDEIEFNKILTKQKKRVSGQVRSMLQDRGSLHVEKPKLLPQPPPRPYELRGGHWKNPEPAIKPGWRTFSLGVGLMD